MSQLICFHKFVEILKEIKCLKTDRIYIQDPAFKPQEEHFIREHFKWTILTTTEEYDQAQEQMRRASNTFLAIWSVNGVIGQMIHPKFPRLLVSPPLNTSGEDKLLPETITPRLIEFLGATDSESFDHSVLGGCVLRWLKGSN